MADNNIKEIIQQQEEIWRERSDNSDQNTLRFARRTVQIYGEMKLLTEKEVNNTANMTDEQIIEFLASKKLSTLTGEQELEFCDRFVGDAEKLDFIPPYFWGKAYERVRKLAQNDASQQERLNKIGAMIDMFAQNFDVSGGLVVDGKNNFVSGAPLNFVDVTNIGDVYARFKEMLDARREDVSDNMREIYERDYKKLDDAIAVYDEMYGMGGVDESKSDNIAARYDDLSRVSDQAQLHDDKYELISKVKFLDSKGNVEAQFVNANGEQHVDWESGDRLIKGGRADTMFDFARIEYIKRNLCRTDKEIDAQEAEDEINELMVEKLYELDVADKIARGFKEDPNAFTRPDKFKAFVRNLSVQQGGTTISDGGYQATVDGEVNGLAGFFSRVKSKVGNGFKKLGNAVSGLFNRVKPNDKLAAARTTGSYESKREKRKQFFVRILKGFGAAFLASALITVIASAAAAVAGVSLAAGLAMVGVITSIVMSAIQIHKWRKAQRANDLPDDLKTMLKDKRLMASLGVSGLAATAMIFGAFGMPTVAAAFGYTALAAGTGKNAIETFKDAKSSGMGNVESIIWSIFNAGAVVAGGFAGRAVGHSIVNSLFEHNHELVGQKTEKTVSEEVKHEETHRVYPENDTAEKALNSWYKDNPDLLQQRVQAIEAYNAEHGTNYDPYRILRVHALAGGDVYNHNDYHFQNGPDIKMSHMTGYGPAHQHDYGYTSEDVQMVKNLFEPGSATLNDASMRAADQFDLGLSHKGHIGYVNGVSDHQNNLAVQTDLDKSGFAESHRLPDGTPAHSLYANAGEFPHDETNVWTETVTHTEDVWNPVLNNLMASYGIYNRQNNNVDVIDRPGAKPDTTITRQDKGQKEPEKPEQPTPVPPKKPAEPEKPKEQPALTEGEKPRALLPQNTTETGVVRVIQTDGGIVKNTPATDIEDVDYEEVEPEQLPSGPTFPALNAHKEEPVFGMTIEDADKFFQLQWQIERGEKDKAKGIKSQYTEDLVGNQDDLNEMRNELGRPTDDEITRAINDAWARQDILKYQGMIAEKEMDIAKIDQNNLSEKKQRKLDNLVLQMEIYKEEIEKLGGEKMLDTSNLVYYKAVKGVGRVNKESRGNPVKTQNGKSYEYSEGNQPRVVAGPLSEKQNIDDERRSNANKKKKTKEENKPNKKKKTKTVENKTKEVKNNDEKIARFAKAIDKMTDEQKGAIEIVMDLINKNSEKRA